MSFKNQFETVIGLEVHCQLDTQTKLFCSCSAKYSGAHPNSHICPVCLGHPGVLPVLNARVLDLASRACLVLNCRLPKVTTFDRKHYFYPDLPKAYQITQLEKPIGEHGFLEFTTEANTSRKIPILRIHMEEDAGKSIHTNGQESLVDFNRCSVPLLEIVTEPDLRNSSESKAFLEMLRRVLRFAEVSECDMENGTLRCDVNLSIRKLGERQLGERVEIKNLNSFRSVVRAIEYEEYRHASILIAGGKIQRGTLLWDEDNSKTRMMRSKELEDDYRYFPDPDLPPIYLREEFIQEIGQKIPELPARREKRFTEEYGLTSYNAALLCQEKELADYFERACSKHHNPTSIANWILTELLREFNKSTKSLENQLKAEYLAALVQLIDEDSISGKIAKSMLTELIERQIPPSELISEKGLSQISDSTLLETKVLDVLASNPSIVEELRIGKNKAIGFLMGQVMKATAGKANPRKVQSLLRELLKKNYSITLDG